MNSLQNTNIKLLAFDINSVTSSDPNTFYRKRTQISRVEIAGIVVTLDHKPDKFTRFSIDDGTGCIQCIMWVNHLTSPYFSRRCTSDVRCIAQMANIHSSRVKLGEFLKVRGRLSVYRGLVQVTVDDVVSERDPNSDVLHWLDCVKLARKCYDVSTSRNKALFFCFNVSE